MTSFYTPYWLRSIANSASGESLTLHWKALVARNDDDDDGWWELHIPLEAIGTLLPSPAGQMHKWWSRHVEKLQPAMDSFGLVADRHLRKPLKSVVKMPPNEDADGNTTLEDVPEGSRDRWLASTSLLLCILTYCCICIRPLDRRERAKIFLKMFVQLLLSADGAVNGGFHTLDVGLAGQCPQAKDGACSHMQCVLDYFSK